MYPLALRSYRYSTSVDCTARLHTIRYQLSLLSIHSRAPLPTNQHTPKMEDLHTVTPSSTQPSNRPSARTTEGKKSRTHHEKGAARLTHAPPTNPTFDCRAPTATPGGSPSHARGCGTIMRAPRCKSFTLCAPPRKKPMLAPVHAQHKTQPIHTHTPRDGRTVGCADE